MWFTQVSLKNPVFATMVMLAIVVLGLFSYQRLKVDQFPDIDFPVVVVTVDYPGASPEIVESEVTKKIEEGVNSIAGINALTSRSYEGTAVVIIEFQLHIDGRKAAEDVREKVAIVRPTLRTEVKEPRVMRFDPASRAVWSLAVLPDDKAGATERSVSAARLPQGAKAPSGGSEPRAAGSVGVMLPGMFARGEFALGSSDALTVPQEALVVRDGFSYVFVVGAEQRVQMRKVQTGRRVADRVEVLSGLDAQATIAVRGAGFLNDGDVVRVVNTPPAAKTSFLNKYESKVALALMQQAQAAIY